jgi:signal peptidase
MTMIDTAVRPIHPTPAVPQSSWRYFRKIFSTAMTVAMVLVAALSLTLSLAVHKVGEGDYQAFGHPVMTMLSGSMSPVIPTGDLVIDDKLTTAQAQNLHVGQIISFRIAANSPVVITHRIVKVERLDGSVAYVTKGDANSSIDTPARPWSNVIGVVAHSVPQGGYFLDDVHTPLFMVVFLLVVMVWLSVGPMVRWARRANTTPAKDAAS